MTNGQIETTLGELVEAAPGLDAIAKKKGWPEKTRYHVYKLAKVVGAETKVWWRQREALLNELEIEDGKQIAPATVKAANARIAEINQVPVTIAWGPLTRKMLDGAKHEAADITAAELLALGPLYVDDDEPDADTEKG